MCSWCWGFSENLAAFQTQLSQAPETYTITWRYLMGGLAPDSDEPMPLATQETIQHHWHAVAQGTGATFNFDFWSQCKPRRSTWPACRAVIAAGLQNDAAIPAMIHGIQEAYYTKAKNPSDVGTLISVAVAIGLDEQQFIQDLQSSLVEDLFRAQRDQCHAFGISGFPALVAEKNNTHAMISSGYSKLETIHARFKQFVNS